jgi:hypothetical protein
MVFENESQVRIFSDFPSYGGMLKCSATIYEWLQYVVCYETNNETIISYSFNSIIKGKIYKS